MSSTEWARSQLDLLELRTDALATAFSSLRPVAGGRSTKLSYAPNSRGILYHG